VKDAAIRGSLVPFARFDAVVLVAQLTHPEACTAGLFARCLDLSANYVFWRVQHARLFVACGTGSVGHVDRRDADAGPGIAVGSIPLTRANYGPQGGGNEDRGDRSGCAADGKKRRFRRNTLLGDFCVFLSGIPLAFFTVRSQQLMKPYGS
jgi:hypothetical protein